MRDSVMAGGWRHCFGTAAAAAILLLGLTSCSVGPIGSGAKAETFTNPVYAHNFPDPYVLQVGRTFYAYSTGTCSYNLQVIHSTDLVHWTGHKDALPRAPRWTVTDCDPNFQNRLMWAPEVLHRSDGTYLLYYAAHDENLGYQCVGLATSSSPDGPFVDRSKQPFLCQKPNGTIDPDVFRDSDGRLYLYYKNELSPGTVSYLWGQRLSADGRRLLGRPTKLDSIGFDRWDTWEGSFLEAPTMFKHGGKYYLFYSSNSFASPQYASGYAVCKGPVQPPCVDARENPVLKSRCRAAGPGHQSIIADDSGQTWIVYHAWKPNDVGDRQGGAGRQLWIDRLDWKNGKAVVHGPTCAPQPVPAVKG